MSACAGAEACPRRFPRSAHVRNEIAHLARPRPDCLPDDNAWKCMMHMNRRNAENLELPSSMSTSCGIRPPLPGPSRPSNRQRRDTAAATPLLRAARNGAPADARSLREDDERWAAMSRLGGPRRRCGRGPLAETPQAPIPARREPRLCRAAVPPGRRQAVARRRRPSGTPPRRR